MTSPVPRDPALVLMGEARECFFCGRETFLLDLCYGGPYCGRDDAEIHADLVRLDARSDAQDSHSRR